MHTFHPIIAHPHFTLTILLILFAAPSFANTKNGFDLSNSSIPRSEIFHGGPPKDGIPAIDAPKFISSAQATFLAPKDRVLGIVVNGEPRAYPIRILNWHEIVNDAVGNFHFVVTFCPLCNTGMAFEAQVDEDTLQFGVSGLLHQSDVLLYDRQSNSLWSQVMREAVTGIHKGRQLTQLPLLHTTWTDWHARHPNTAVLSTQTGFQRDYSASPYQGYSTSKAIYFDINHQPPANYHPKEQVLGLTYKGQHKAYPFQELSQNSKQSFTDKLAGDAITIEWNEDARTALVKNGEGQVIPSTIAFWFAWYTFHPTTAVYKYRSP